MQRLTTILGVGAILIFWACGSSKETVKDTPQSQVSTPAPESKEDTSTGSGNAEATVKELNKQLAKVTLKNFPVAKAEISKQAWEIWSKASLKAVSSAVAKLPPGYVLQLTGHCDPRGDDAYNDNLSVERAQFVKEQLSQNGINVSKVVTKGEGKRKLADPKNPTSGANRRVEFLVVKQ